MINNLEIKKMESDDEIRGKAYVHWKSLKAMADELPEPKKKK